MTYRQIPLFDSTDRLPIKALVGSNLQRRMSEKGISQRMLAALMGTTQTTVSCWVTARKTIDLDRLDHICQALDVTPEYLIRRHG